MGMERLVLKIYGRVQGVFFRANTQKEAIRLGLLGEVRNTDDGCVEVVAEGERAKLEKLLFWCRKGPDGARVDNIDVAWEAADNSFKTFRISY